MTNRLRVVADEAVRHVSPTVRKQVQRNEIALDESVDCLGGDYEEYEVSVEPADGG